MDFHSMKRKELQVLCKKHKIPANLSNHEMANRLAEVFKEEKNPSSEGLVDGKDENASETEKIDIAVNGKTKKVRFSPEHELIEFTRSGNYIRSRGNLTSTRCSSLPAESVDSGQVSSNNLGYTGRVTRARGLKSVEAKKNEKKRGRDAGKHHAQEDGLASVEAFATNELQESDVNCPRRANGFRGKVGVEAVKNGSKQERKRARIDDIADKNDPVNDGGEKLIEERVDVPGRLTRTRRQKLMKEPLVGERDTLEMVDVPGRLTRTRRQKLMEEPLEGGRDTLERNENAAQISVEIEPKEEVSRNARRMKNNVKGEGDVSDNQKIQAHVQIEPSKKLRRSRRNASMIGDSEISHDDSRKDEIGGIEALNEAPRLLATDRSDINADSIADEVDPSEVGQPIKLGRRTRTRDGISSQEERQDAEVKAKTESRYLAINPVQQSRTVQGLSKDSEQKLLNSTHILPRSRRLTLSLEPVSSDVNLNNGADVEIFETEKDSSKLAEKTSPVSEKNIRRSRRNAAKCKSPEIVHETRRSKSSISLDVRKTNNVSNALPRSMGKRKTRQNVTPAAAATVEVSDKRSPASILKQPHTLDDGSSQEGFLEAGESLSLDPQLSLPVIPEIDENPDSNSGVCVKNNSSGRDTFVADGTGGSESTNSVEKNELPRNADHTDYESQNSSGNFREVQNVHLAVDFDVQKSTEQFTSEIAKNGLEAHVLGQTEGSRCNSQTKSCQILREGSNVSRNVGCAESSFLADQTDIKSPEAIKGEVNKQAQPRLEGLDLAHEARDVPVTTNPEYIETGNSNVVNLPFACQHKEMDHLEISNNSHENKNTDTVLEAGEASAFASHERLSIMLSINLEEDNFIEGDETNEDGCLKGHNSATEKQKEVSDLFGDGTFEEDYSVANLDEKGKHDSSLVVVPVILCAKSTESIISRSIEDHIAKRDETNIAEYTNLQSTQTDEGGSSSYHKSKDNEDGDFISLLFDSERSGSIASEHGEAISTEYSENGSDKRAMFHDIATQVTMSGTCTSSLQEIAPATPNDVSESQAKEAGGVVVESGQGERNVIYQSKIPGEVISTASFIEDEEQETENQADEHSQDDTCEQAIEQPNSPLVKPIVNDSDTHGKQAWSNQTEKGLTVSISNTNSIYRKRQEVHGSNINDDANDADWKDVEDFIDVFSKDVVTSVQFTESSMEAEHSKLAFENMEEAEYQCNNLLSQPAISSALAETGDVESSQSWTVDQFNILFGTTIDDFTSPGSTDIPCQGTEAVNLTMSTEKSKINSGGSLIKMNKEMEGKEPAETSDRTVDLPITFKEACETGSSFGWEENQLKLDSPESTASKMKTKQFQTQLDEGMKGDGPQLESSLGTELKLLFATANKATSKASDCARKLDSPVPFKEGTASKMKTKLSPMQLDEEMKDAGPQLESSLGPKLKLLFATPTKVTSEASAPHRKLDSPASKMNTKLSPLQLDEVMKDAGPQLESSLGPEPKLLFATSIKETSEASAPYRKLDSLVPVKEGTASKMNAKLSPVQLDEVMKDASPQLESSLGPELQLLFALSIKETSEASAPDRKLDSPVPLKEGSASKMNTKLSPMQLDEVMKDAEPQLESSLGPELKLLFATPIKETYEASAPDRKLDSPVPLKDAGPQHESILGPELKLLFATPINTTYEASTPDRKLDSSVPLKEVTASKMNTKLSLVQLDEEMKNAGPQLESSLCPELKLLSATSIKETSEASAPDRKLDCPVHLKEGTASKMNIKLPSVQLDEEMKKAGHQLESDLGSELKLLSATSIKETSEASAPDRKLDCPVHLKEGTASKMNIKLPSVQLDEEMKEAGHQLEGDLGSELKLLFATPLTPELMNTFEEESGSDVSMLPGTGHESPVCIAQSDEILCSSAMHLLLGAIETVVENTEAGIPVFSSEADHEMDAEGIEENATKSEGPSIHELHFRAKSEELSVEVHTVSDAPAPECNVILKESDVSDSIKEYYINPELSLAAISHESGLTPPYNVFTHLENMAPENAASADSQEDIDRKFLNFDGDNLKPSAETEMKEPAAVPSGSPPRLISEGPAAFSTKSKMEPGDCHRFSSKQVQLTAKQNARTILIHGTPRKPLAAMDMKENALSRKALNLGDFATPRPAKRPALRDVKW